MLDNPPLLAWLHTSVVVSSPRSPRHQLLVLLLIDPDGGEHLVLAHHGHVTCTRVGRISCP